MFFFAGNSTWKPSPNHLLCKGSQGAILEQPELFLVWNWFVWSSKRIGMHDLAIALMGSGDLKRTPLRRPRETGVGVVLRLIALFTNGFG